MKYLVLIYHDEAHWSALSEDDQRAIYGRYEALDDDPGAVEILRGAELQPTSTATTVRVRDGDPLVTDGPFAETKEQLGGYYVIEAASLDEAIAFAGRVPAAETGSIEIRPIARG